MNLWQCRASLLSHCPVCLRQCLCSCRSGHLFQFSQTGCGRQRLSPCSLARASGVFSVPFFNGCACFTTIYPFGGRILRMIPLLHILQSHTGCESPPALFPGAVPWDVGVSSPSLSHWKEKTEGGTSSLCPTGAQAFYFALVLPLLDCVTAVTLTCKMKEVF